MYHHPRHTRDHPHTLLAPGLGVLVVTFLGTLLVPVGAAVLLTYPAPSAGLLLAVALVALARRVHHRIDEPTPGRPADVPITG